MLIIKIGDDNSVTIYINSIYTFVLLQTCMTFLILWATNKEILMYKLYINYKLRGNRIGQDHKPGFELKLLP